MYKNICDFNRNEDIFENLDWMAKNYQVQLPNFKIKFWLKNNNQCTNNLVIYLN